jgi:nicotinate-nucleotide adenylyltransferase
MCPAAPEKGSNWGIMGGIFDPIHYGHLILAESALRAFNFDGILFIPSFNPPHRQIKPIASFDDRYKMTMLAIDGHDKFYGSDLEKDLKSPGYTLAIVDFLKLRFSGVEWHLILGADNLAQFDNWHKPEELIARVKIAVGSRHGVENNSSFSKWIERVLKFDMPLIEISSTQIRDLIKAGKSIRYLLPEEVRQFIIGKGLYR